MPLGRTIKRTIKWKGDVADSASHVPTVPVHSKQQESRLLLYSYFNQSPSSCLGKGELKLKAERELQKGISLVDVKLLEWGTWTFRSVHYSPEHQKRIFPHIQLKFPVSYMSHISKSKSSKCRYSRSTFSEGLTLNYHIDRLWWLQNPLIQTKFGFTFKLTFCNSHNKWQDPHSSGLPLLSLCIATIFFLMGSTCWGTNAVIPTHLINSPVT